MNNIEKCKKLTQERDWAGIFDLNGLEIDSFGTKKELSVLEIGRASCRERV